MTTRAIIEHGDITAFVPDFKSEPAEAMTRESHPLAVATRPDDGDAAARSAGNNREVSQ